MSTSTFLSSSVSTLPPAAVLLATLFLSLSVGQRQPGSGGRPQAAPSDRHPQSTGCRPAGGKDQGCKLSGEDWGRRTGRGSWGLWLNCMGSAVVFKQHSCHVERAMHSQLQLFARASMRRVCLLLRRTQFCMLLLLLAIYLTPIAGCDCYSTLGSRVCKSDVSY